jgi:hypothetical protein
MTLFFSNLVAIITQRASGTLLGIGTFGRHAIAFRRLCTRPNRAIRTILNKNMTLTTTTTTTTDNNYLFSTSKDICWAVHRESSTFLFDITRTFRIAAHLCVWLNTKTRHNNNNNPKCKHTNNIQQTDRQDIECCCHRTSQVCRTRPPPDDTRRSCWPVRTRIDRSMCCIWEWRTDLRSCSRSSSNTIGAHTK